MDPVADFARSRGGASEEMPVLRVFTRFSVKRCRGALQNDLQHERECLSRSKKTGRPGCLGRKGRLELGEIRRPARENIILRLKRSLINKNPLYF